MKVLSGDVMKLIDYLWDEERIEKILKKDWKLIESIRSCKSEEVDMAVSVLNELYGTKDYLNFFHSLSTEISDCILFDFAKELKLLSHKAKYTVH